jgi:tRNA-specific 2-thiouridylase
VACNRHLKFDRFLRRASQLGFDAVATGHHARITRRLDGSYQLRRGTDPAKDQSYVLHMLTQAELGRALLPIGELTKAEVRGVAGSLGLRTAAKPDSQDVCFITKSGGREAFLGARIELHPGRLVDAATGQEEGKIPAVELVTVGQRRGLGDHYPGAARRYALNVDVAAATVTLGSIDNLLVDRVELRDLTWVHRPVPLGREVEVQMSAHGRPVEGVFESGDILRFLERQRRTAPGQSVVMFEGDRVLGGGIAC